MLDSEESGRPDKPEPADPAIASSERFLAWCGYALVMASVFSFGIIGYMKLREAQIGTQRNLAATWLEFIQIESPTIGLLLIGILTATLGKRLLTTVQVASARTIPREDFDLVKEAIQQGKPEPIDQYVRLRSLSGVSGLFQKIGLTGLPLTTVFLTLVFSAVSVTPSARAEDFLDLAKLTLGAFIGSFVQRQVERRREEEESSTQPKGSSFKRADLPA